MMMVRRICPAERHPLLVACNIVTLCFGLGLAFQGLFFDTTEPGAAFTSSFLIGIVLMFLGTNTGKLTQNFHHWDYGLTLAEKVFASLSVFIGALVGGWAILDILNFLN
jgi:hypothetical protein